MEAFIECILCTKGAFAGVVSFSPHNNPVRKCYLHFTVEDSDVLENSPSIQPVCGEAGIQTHLCLTS